MSLYTTRQLSWSEDGAILSKKKQTRRNPDTQIAKASVTYMKKVIILLFSKKEITWNLTLLQTKCIQNDS